MVGYRGYSSARVPIVCLASTPSLYALVQLPLLLSSTLLMASSLSVASVAAYRLMVTAVLVC